MKKYLTIIGLLFFTSIFVLSCKQNADIAINYSDNTISQYNNNSLRFPNFTTVDLNDNTMTEDVFKSKDLTIINFWGTYCPPCIQEMPELGDWSKELPDNVQLIGIIIDVDNKTKMNKDTALQIVNETGANYTHLLMSDDFMTFAEQLIGVPTTFFVDKNLNVVAEPIIGAYVSQYKITLNTILNEEI